MSFGSAVGDRFYPVWPGLRRDVLRLPRTAEAEARFGNALEKIELQGGSAFVLCLDFLQWVQLIVAAPSAVQGTGE